MKEITLRGRLGTHPEVQVCQDGRQIITFPVAVNSPSKTKWHRVVVYEEDKFQKIKETLKKGNYVEIKGKLIDSFWKDKFGKDRKKELIVIEGNEDDVNLYLRPSLPSYYF